MGPKANAPDREGLRSGAFSDISHSGLASLQLRLAARLVFRRVATRLGSWLAPWRRVLAARLGPWLVPWWRLLAARLGPWSLVLRRAAFRLLWPSGLIRSIGALPTILTVAVARLVAALGPVRPVRLRWTVGLRAPVRLIGPIGPRKPIPTTSVVTVGSIRSLPAAPTVVVITLIAGGGPLARGRNHADTAKISTTDADIPAPVVVHGPLTHPRDEGLRALSVPEDESGFGALGTREHDARATVIAVRVVVRIVVDHDPEAHARVIVRAPVRIAHVAMAVVAQEARIIIVLLHVIRDDIVVPIPVAVRDDALREIRQRDVWIAADAAVRNRAVVPMLVALEAVVDERIGGGDAEDVADARVVIHVKRILIGSALHLVLAARAGEVVLPRLAGKQDAHATVGVDAQDRDVRVPVGAEVHARTVAAVVRVVAPIGPDFDARAVAIRGWRPRDNRGRAGHGDEAEQSECGQHKCLRRGAKSRHHANKRPRAIGYKSLSLLMLQSRSGPGKPQAVLYPGQLAAH